VALFTRIPARWWPPRGHGRQLPDRDAAESYGYYYSGLARGQYDEIGFGGEAILRNAILDRVWNVTDTGYLVVAAVTRLNLRPSRKSAFSMYILMHLG